MKHTELLDVNAEEEFHTPSPDTRDGEPSGHTLGSQDTETADSEEDDDENDSFIVSDCEEDQIPHSTW